MEHYKELSSQSSYPVKGKQSSQSCYPVKKTIETVIRYTLYLFFFSLIFSNALAQSLVVLLTILWIIRIILTPNYKFIRTPLDIPFLLFIGARTLSIFTSVDISLSMRELRGEIFFYISYFIVTNNLNNKDWNKEIITIFRLLILSAIIISFYSITNFFVYGIDRAEASAGGYYRLALFLAIVLGMTLGLSSRKDIFYHKVLWYVTFSIFMISLLLTKTRAAWISVGVSILIIGIYKEKLLIFLTTAIVSITLLFSPSIQNRLVTLLTPLEKTTLRLTLWENASKIALDHPLLGYGLNTFKSIFPDQDLVGGHLRTWHNNYIQLFIESGLMGLLSFLYLSIRIFKIFWERTKERQSNRILFELFLPLMLSIISLYISGVFASFTVEPVISLLFNSLVAIISFLGIQNAAAPQKR